MKSRLLSPFSEVQRCLNLGSFDSRAIQEWNVSCQFKFIIMAISKRRKCAHFFLIWAPPWICGGIHFSRDPQQFSRAVFWVSSGAQERPALFSLVVLENRCPLRGHQVYLGLKPERAGARLAVLGTHGIRSQHTRSARTAPEGRLDRLCSWGYLLHVAGKNLFNCIWFFSLEQDLELVPESGFWEQWLSLARVGQIFCLSD